MFGVASFYDQPVTTAYQGPIMEVCRKNNYKPNIDTFEKDCKGHSAKNTVYISPL